MSETKEKDMFIADIWQQAWCAAVKSGHRPRKAAKYADACVKQIKERFDGKPEKKE